MAFDVRALRAILTGRTGRPYPKSVSWKHVSYCKVCGCVYADDMKEVHDDSHRTLIEMLDEIDRLRTIINNLTDVTWR